MRYRLLTVLAAGLIALAGVLTVRAGGTPPLPPPVVLRGPAGGPISEATDGLQFVPPTVAELAARDATASEDSPEVATADSPDVADGAEETPQSSSVLAESADTPEMAETASVDSPDLDDSPDPDDSPDSTDSPDG